MSLDKRAVFAAYEHPSCPTMPEVAAQFGCTSARVWQIVKECGGGTRPSLKRYKGERCPPDCECYRHSAEFRAKVGAANSRRPRRPVAERFWEKVAVGAPDECWEWQASKRSDGRGQFNWQGQPESGSRLAWIFTHGPITNGLFVLHSCDNPPCCNPAHLWLGTQAENIADMWAKDRHPRCGNKKVAA